MTVVMNCWQTNGMLSNQTYLLSTKMETGRTNKTPFYSPLIQDNLGEPVLPQTRTTTGFL